MLYQFTLDDRPAGPIREWWIDAANDAVDAGYATWIDSDAVKIDDSQGASIKRYGGS